MVKRPAPRVNKPAAPAWRFLIAEQSLIWASLGGLALLLYLTGLDVTLAQATADQQSAWAWQFRQYSSLPATLCAAAALVALFFPRLSIKRPALYKSFAALLITTVLGAGLLNQVIVQELADRHRPRETVLLAPTDSLPAEFSGNSMPSGHAAMGFVLAAPFFVLRRTRHRKLAYASLAAGLGAGLIIGYARMVLGAHFASDVLIAGALTLATASLAAATLARWPHVRRKWLALATFIALAAIILGNHFTLTLTHPLPDDFRRAKLPCGEIKAVYTTQVTKPTMVVQLSGYGAPVSTIQLVEKHGVISLQRKYGLYHTLSCAARLNMPIGPYE